MLTNFNNCYCLCCFSTSRRMPSRSAEMYKPSAYVTYDIDAVHSALFNK